MKYVIAISSLIFSTSIYASGTLREVNAELKKIQAYKAQGITDPSIETKEKELLAQKSLLEKKSKKKTESKEMKSSQITELKNNFSEQLEFLKKIENNEEKIVAIQKKIAEQRAALVLAINSEKREEKVVSFLRDSIDILESEKAVYAGRVDSSKKDNNLSNVKIGANFDFFYLKSSNGSGDSKGTKNRNDDTQSIRFYDNLANDFTVNLAEINFSGSVGQMSYYMDLDFGNYAEQNAVDDEVNKHIGQAYMTYDFDGKHSLTVGKMYSHVGFELAKAIDNWNYSRSTTFGYGIPFWHDGAAVKGSYENGLRWGLFAYDRTDTTRVNNSGKSYGAQLSWVGERFSSTYNFISGPEQEGQSGDMRTIHQMSAQYNLTADFSLALDGLTGVDEGFAGNGHDQKWQSGVFYANWKFLEKWRLAARLENFKETTSSGASLFRLGSSVTGPVDIVTQTATLGYSLGNKNEVRLEFRHDGATRAVFAKPSGSKSKSQDTASLSWVIGF